MSNMPLIVSLCVFEQDYFLRESIESIVNYVDKIIVIEGAWQSCVQSNGGVLRSRDNTIPILKELSNKYPDKIEVHYLNESTQLKQRSKHFDIFSKPHWLWIVDSDEIYTQKEAKKVVDATKRTDFEYFDTKSLTFVNDYRHYVEINWPRLFQINGPGYVFRSPNHLLKPDKSELQHCEDPIAKYYHYSYIMTADRMHKKIADRIETHGSFKWVLQNGWIKRKGIAFKETNFKPDIVKRHPMLTREAPEEAFIYKEPEKIGFIINSGIGNAILATPMLKAIRLLKPNARISVFNWERTRDVFSGLKFIDDNIMPKNYDKFIDSIEGLDYLLCSPTAHLNPQSLMSGAKEVIKIDKGGKWDKHESEYNMDLAYKLGYNAPQPNPSFNTEQEPPPKKYIVVSIGYIKDSPHWALKQIADNNEWVESLNLLLDKGYVLLFVGSSDDFSTSQELINKLNINDTSGVNILNLCGSTTLKDVATLIKGTNLFIGLDGGLAHIAACYQIPSLICWTFTSLTKNKPLNSKLMLVINHCEHRNICQHKKYTNCTHKRCRDIKSDEIKNQLKKICYFYDI